ncbi:hypothetical protein EDD80_12212 [Anseongella ginsenosidimutans]|uniref:Uncharacterized protein n=1 Tax=Anseongella ginsenosidimutans TaxID=496056 RepID=A0A4R3KL50_9SPHI|nr:hypothetical protein [Anseongella ginsenosidimutans]QEC54000.1 hypothetical protein FRZ59_17780 [Anseongella ginsenosidimutans]TCS84292.1 hypothetical protein EDD80_12212 [Anseongella ginsenosidimutans]
MIIRLTALFFLVIAVSSCTHKQGAEYYELNEKIAQRWSEIISDSLDISGFDFCDLLPEADWDSVLIIPPFTPMDKISSLNLSNVNKVTGKLKGVSITDHKVGALFIEENAIVFYSLLDRRLDFSLISSFDKEECTHLRIVERSNEGQPSYVVLLND